MKTKLLTLAIALLFSINNLLIAQCPASGYTCIPDPNFEQALLDLNIDTEDIKDGRILTVDISEVTSLNVSGYFISNMTGIEDFAALQTLDCSSNNLTHLDLFSNTLLTDINCNQNFIGNSGGQLILPDNNTLVSLKCGGNNLSSLNVDNYPALELLHCYNNDADLGTLSLFYNTALIELNCHDSGVGSLDISQCTMLQKLLCYNGNGTANPLNTLDISANTELTELHCNGNNISLLNFTNNTKLLKIICDANPLGSINVSMLPDLEWLWCWNTNLTSLDVSSNLALKRLDFGGNSITTGNLLLPNTDTLEYLWGYNNSLTGTINTNAFTNLINMDFTGNNLTSIDVSNNIALTDLWIGDNNLSTIDVSNNPLIEDFDCWQNNLTGVLDVSMLTVLDRFWCYNNQLSTINAKNTNNSDIAVFNATNNNSSLCIQVDNKILADAGYPGWSKDASASYEEICSGLSTDEFSLSNISIYPNPAKDKFYIELQLEANYSLSNVFGQEVKKGLLVSGNNELETNTLATGLYLLKIESAEGNITKKLIKN